MSTRPKQPREVIRIAIAYIRNARAKHASDTVSQRILLSAAKNAKRDAGQHLMQGNRPKMSLLLDASKLLRDVAAQTHIGTTKGTKFDA